MDYYEDFNDESDGSKELNYLVNVIKRKANHKDEETSDQRGKEGSP